MEAARRNLAAYGIENVTFAAGDGTAGWPEEAPFDAILVSAAFDRVPEPLAEQLTPGGRLVQPVGPGGHETVTVFTKDDGELVELSRLTAARFVRLVGEWGFGGDAP